MIEVGLTPRMLGALKFITEHVAQRGEMPSRSQLAIMMDCHKTHAARTVARLVERGAVHSASPGGALSGFGSDGIAVVIPSELAATLARYCSDNDERFAAVVSDAIALHLDECGSTEDHRDEIPRWADFGVSGVAVFIPINIVARLFRYCSDKDERICAVIEDAITLHLDSLEVAAEDFAALAVADAALGGDQ